MSPADKLAEALKLADAYAEASFDQGLHQRKLDPAPEKARETLAAFLAAPQPEAQALPLTNRLTPYTAVAVAMDLASLLAGSVAMSNKEEADTYSARLRSHLIKYIHAAAQPEPIAALSSPAPAPLTDEAIAARNPYAHSANHRSVWAAGFRDAERAHKIGIVSGGGA